MSKTWHTIEVTAGPFSWTVTPETLAADDPTADGSLLDQLSITTGWDTRRPLGAQPAAWVATFGIVVSRLADLAALTVGDPVSILVWYDAPQAVIDFDGSTRPPLGQFVGRVSDMDAEPHESGRTLVTVTCTDYLVDLGQYTVGSVAYPAELMGDRFTRLFKEAGFGVEGGLGEVPFYYLYGYARATDPNPQSLLEAVTTLLNESTGSDGTSGGLHGANLCTIYLALNLGIDFDDVTGQLLYTDHLEPVAPFTTAPAFKKNDAGVAGQPQNLPGVLAETADGWTVVLSPREWLDRVVPANMVDLGVQWHRGRATRVDQVTVVTADDPPLTKVRYMPNPVPIDYTEKCELLNGAPNAGLNADLLAATLLPEQAENGWSVDQITLLDIPATFPVTYTTATMPAYGDTRRLLVIDGVDPDLNPTGLGFHMGTTTNATLRFASGAWRMELELDPAVPRPFAWPASRVGADNDADGDVDADDGPPYLSPGTVPAGITPADLAPTLTPYALRIVRRPDPA